MLSRSIKQNKVLEIQLNSLDEFDRVKPHVFGVFRGMAEFDVVLIGDFQIDFYDIRHIKIHNFLKLSLTTITAMEIFMKTYDYQGKLIKEDNNTTSIAYVQCACGCLASRVYRYKCSLCKRIYVLKKRAKS